MCRGLGLSFGYNAFEGEEHTLSISKLISLLVATVANNGNLLINIGPKADGSIPEIQKSKLLGLGHWLKTNGEAIYGTSCSNFHSIETDIGSIHFTQKNQDIFIFLDKLNSGDTTLFIPDITGIPVALDASTDIVYTQRDKGLEITVNKHDPLDYTVVLRVSNEK